MKKPKKRRVRLLPKKTETLFNFNEPSMITPDVDCEIERMQDGSVRSNRAGKVIICWDDGSHTTFTCGNYFGTAIPSGPALRA